MGRVKAIYEVGSCSATWIGQLVVYDHDLDSVNLVKMIST